VEQGFKVGRRRTAVWHKHFAKTHPRLFGTPGKFPYGIFEKGDKMVKTVVKQPKDKAIEIKKKKSFFKDLHDNREYLLMIVPGVLENV